MKTPTILLALVILLSSLASCVVRPRTSAVVVQPKRQTVVVVKPSRYHQRHSKTVIVRR